MLPHSVCVVQKDRGVFHRSFDWSTKGMKKNNTWPIENDQERRSPSPKMTSVYKNFDFYTYQGVSGVFYLGESDAELANFPGQEVKNSRFADDSGQAPSSDKLKKIDLGKEGPQVLPTSSPSSSSSSSPSSGLAPKPNPPVIPSYSFPGSQALKDRGKKQFLLGENGAIFYRHYYLEGDWGYVIVACASLCQAINVGSIFSTSILGLHSKFHEAHSNPESDGFLAGVYEASIYYGKISTI